MQKMILFVQICKLKGEKLNKALQNVKIEFGMKNPKCTNLEISRIFISQHDIRTCPTTK